MFVVCLVIVGGGMKQLISLHMQIKLKFKRNVIPIFNR